MSKPKSMKKSGVEIGSPTRKQSEMPAAEVKIVL